MRWEVGETSQPPMLERVPAIAIGFTVAPTVRLSGAFGPDGAPQVVDKMKSHIHPASTHDKTAVLLIEAVPEHMHGVPVQFLNVARAPDKQADRPRHPGPRAVLEHRVHGVTWPQHLAKLRESILPIRLRF